jgi:hypothetical protein
MQRADGKAISQPGWGVLESIVRPALGIRGKRAYGFSEKADFYCFNMVKSHQ